MHNDELDLKYISETGKIINKLSINISKKYSHINFNGAIQRDLYVAARINLKLREFYIDFKKKNLKKKYVFFTQLSYLIANQIKLNHNLKIDIIFDLNKKSIVQNKIFSSFNFLNKIKNLKINKKEILFITHSKKHKEYLLSIFGRKKKYKYFHSSDLKRVSFFQQNYPYLKNDYFFINKYIKFANYLELLIEKFKPKAIVTVEGDNYFDAIIPIIAKKHKIKSFCLQWGITAPLIRFISNSKFGYKNYFSHDYFFSWGKVFSKTLRTLNKKTNFIEAGNPKIKKGSNKKKGVLIVHCGFKKYDENNIHINRNFYEYIKLLAKKYKKLPFVIRLNYEITSFEKRYFQEFVKFKNIKFEKPENKNLSNSLKNKKIVISTTSTTLIEGLASKCVPVCFPGKAYLKWFDKFNKMKIGGIVRNNSQGIKLFDKIYFSSKKHYFKHNNNIIKYLGNHSKREIISNISKILDK